MIPFNRACFDGAELAYLGKAILNGHVAGCGPFTATAESLIAGVQGEGTTILTTSCTHALEIAARLLDLQAGDEVIVPSFTFVSTAAAFMLHGATPVFVDVDPSTLNLDPDLVEAAITSRTRAICIVHYAGVGAEPDRFRRIADRHGIILVEDNAHGFFATWDGRPLGTFGHLSTMSFHETKNITCGEGGALHINDERFVARAEILRDKGTDRSRFLRGQVDKYTWVDLGSSWVLSDLLAAVLVGQLERSGEIQRRRHAIWSRYDEGLRDWAAAHDVRTPVVPARSSHGAHMYQLRFDDLSTRSRFIEHMRAREVLTVFHYQPLHLSAIGVRLGGAPGDCPNAEQAGDDLVRLPVFFELTDEQLDHIVRSVVSFEP
jgi:dTDP-4-amino-4,6-dideoxygalactose transaminase